MTEGKRDGVVTDAHLLFGLEVIEENAVQLDGIWYFCAKLAENQEVDTAVRHLFRRPPVGVLKYAGPLGAYRLLQTELMRHGLRNRQEGDPVESVKVGGFNTFADTLKRGHFRPHRGKW